MRYILTCTTLALTALAAPLACGDGVGPSGDVVGGPCSPTQHCAQGSFCKTGGDFPDGMCTVPCGSSDRCPFGSVCIDKDNGICAVSCRVGADCRPGYSCKGKRSVPVDGSEVLVCID